MRRLLLAVSLPLLLTACDQPPTQPAAESEPAAATPAVEQPAEPAPEPQAEADKAPLFGVWAADLSWCGGEGEGFPITISATRFEGRENTCDITELADNGDGTFTASLACTSEGQSTNENVVMEPIFGPTGEGLRLTYVDRGGEPATVFRCETRAAATE